MWTVQSLKVYKLKINFPMEKMNDVLLTEPDCCTVTNSHLLFKSQITPQM